MTRKSITAEPAPSVSLSPSQDLLARRCPWLAEALVRSQQWVHPALEFMTALHFELRTLADGRLVVPLLAGFFPDPARAALGMHELLSNAIEHGSLEIGGEQKARLPDAKDYERLLARRQAEAAYRSRRVVLALQRLDDRVEVTIRDDGPGFAWQEWQERLPASSGESGLALAKRLCFDGLLFEGRGNVVRGWSLI